MKSSLPNLKAKLQIVLKTKDFLVVDKPAGLLVYLPQGAQKEKTLLDLVKPYLNFENPDLRSGIVHRLDRDTSGLLIIARHRDAELKLKQAFKEKKVKKTYLTLVTGRMPTTSGEINIPLGRSSKDRLRIIPAGEGKEAVTAFKVLRYFPTADVSFLEVDLKTGRTHQIRVHLSAIGHALVGDPKYSGAKSELERQFLHAAKLEFPDPTSGKKIAVASELPPELNSFLKNLS